MGKIFFCILLSVVVLMTNGCASVQMVPREEMGPDVYRISARATSRKNLSESVKSAKERCAQENKQYLFVKNIFQHSSNLGIDMVSSDLYFSCVEAGDPRLKERKSPLRSSEEKVEQRDPAQVKQEEHPGPERVAPEKEKPPAQEQPSPAKEQAKEKPSLGTSKEAAPAPEKVTQPKEKDQGQQEGETTVSEEELLRLRKKNPGPGELEDLWKEDSSPDSDDSEDGSDYPIIEESLGGDALDIENYLRYRRKKKKTK